MAPKLSLLAWASGLTWLLRTWTTLWTTFTAWARPRPWLLCDFSFSSCYDLIASFLFQLLHSSLPLQFFLFVGKRGCYLFGFLITDCNNPKLKFDGIVWYLLKHVSDFHLLVKVNEYTAHKFWCYRVIVYLNIFDLPVFIELFPDIIIGKVSVDILNIETSIVLDLKHRFDRVSWFDRFLLHSFLHFNALLLLFGLTLSLLLSSLDLIKVKINSITAIRATNSYNVFVLQTLWTQSLKFYLISSSLYYGSMGGVQIYQNKLHICWKIDACVKFTDGWMLQSEII